MKMARLACVGVLVGVAGCVSLARSEPPQEHFVLGAGTALPDSTPPEVTLDLAVGIRRPKVASYLASSYMVVRRGANQVDFAEFSRWGEPLEAGVNRVVARELVAHGLREVAVAPWPAQARFGYLIEVDVVRFEGLAPVDPDSEEGGVHVLANWTVSRPLDGSTLVRGTTDYRRQGWSAGDYPGLVALLDEGLGVLADDLAAALAGLPRVLDEPGVP
jgi:uncharacterized lipoprotein YmbA